MKKSTYLVAVTLSEHASLKITDYRKKVFRKFGTVSALALPPIIPLAWFQGRPIVDNVPYIKSPGAVIPIGPAVQDTDAFFLSIPQKPALQVVLDWQKLFADDGQSNDDTSILFPVYPGIYICSDNKVDESSEKIELPADPDMEKLTINDFRITCFLLEYHAEKIWWEDLFYSQLWSKRVKGT
ncbi:MAG: hypothetical protein HQ557_02125 [Bacteroidetes bacterium]|nr:hypothetical protein [Bacteroidota bacterium]